MRYTTIVLAATVLLGGCRVDDADREPAQPAAGVPDQQQQSDVQQQRDMHIEVNIERRELTVYRGGEAVETHPVAVGREEYPTPTGEWTIDRVIFNPRWVPPDSEWAEDEETKEPGDPENPMGDAQLVYNRPYSIHGTIEPGSIGEAVSHGSIRVTNDVVMQLARQVIEAGGAQRDESFFRQMREDQSREYEVAIPNPVPIRVVRR